MSPSIPNLYYKLEEEDLMPDYICSAPNTYGMHKCDNLPYYKMDGKVTLKSLTTFATKYGIWFEFWLAFGSEWYCSDLQLDLTLTF